MYATGVGSLPGQDMPGAVRAVLGGFQHAWLPELPARGVGADMVGRTTALMEGLAFDLQPQGWRLGDHAGIDHARARGILRGDLDVLEEHAQVFDTRLTITAAGPWTMAALLERPRGDKVLADHGARREVAESLAAGLVGLLDELRRRLPAIAFDVQLDEPLLPAVMAGQVPTASGFSRLRGVDRPVVADLLHRVTDAVHTSSDRVALHCCAPGLDLDLVGRAGIDLVGLDATRLDAGQLDHLGAWLEGGRALRLGVVDTSIPDAFATADQVTRRALGVLRPLGLDPQLLVDRVSISTACGLAGWSTVVASRQLDALAQAADLLAEQLHR